MEPVYRDEKNIYVPFELGRKLLADPCRAISLIVWYLSDYGTSQSIRKIAKETGIGRSTVHRCVKRLEEWGFSVVEGTAPGFEKPKERN